MKIACDVMGSDKGAEALVKGAVIAAKNNDFDVVLFGNEEEIKAILGKEKNMPSNISVVNAPSVMTMCDKATAVLKEKKDSSLSMALQSVANGECDAVVSSGNSGALITGATLIVKRIKGVKRPAFAPVLPSAGGPVMLLDAGANVDVRPEFLAQFGVMGSVYMEKVIGKKNPRVGLICNGTEETKGNDLTKEALGLLKNTNLNFIGYCEGNAVMEGGVDVAVTDGYTGNVLLKGLEGMGHLMTGKLKKMFTANPLRIIGAAFTIGGIKKFKKEFDSKQYGGAMILGVSAPVVKAHGSADSIAYSVAVKQAAAAFENNVCRTISEYFASLPSDAE